MLNGFTFNGKHSSEFGVFLLSTDRALLPEMTRREKTLSRKNGAYDFGDNLYTKRVISATLTFFNDDMIANKIQARNIAAWLNSKEARKLVFDDEPDKYYYARIYSPLNFATQQAIAEISIEFECQPFAYSVFDTGVDVGWSESDYPWLTEGLRFGGSNNYKFTATGATSFTFDNPGTQETGAKSPQTSKFTLTVQGSWNNLVFTLNGKSLTYSGSATGTLIFDNVNLEATLNGSNALSNITGNLETFLEVLAGQNTLSVTATSLNVIVTIDVRPEWR